MTGRASIRLRTNEPAKRTRRDLLLLAGAAVALQAITWSLLLALYTSRVWYGLHDLADTPYYLAIAEQIARGDWPYLDFPFEYPPLALPFFLLQPSLSTVAAYDYWFSVGMIAVCLTTAVVVALIAARVWDGLARPLCAAAAFAATVVAAGAITVNRFDSTVGLVVALCVLSLVHKRTTLGGVAAGLGFALKLVPVVLLPLVLVLAASRRLALRAAVAAAIAAALPFVPFLVRSPQAFSGALAGQTARGLHIESVAATPYLVWRAMTQEADVVIVPPMGSLVIGAPGTSLLARLAPIIVLGLLIFIYAVIWRARTVLRTDPEWIAPAALATMLAFMCGNKVLSPQHMLWILPLVALCLAARPLSQRLIGMAMLAAIALTQVEFPGLYHETADLQSLPLFVIAVRNVLLLTALVLGVVSMWRVGSTRRRGGTARALQDS